MNQNNQSAAYLLLEDGSLFKGKAVGAKGTVGGELCCNTGMIGFQEILTDPSYAGQVLLLNNCHIGSYGVCEDEAMSDKVQVNALICRELSERYSRQKATGNLEDYLKASDVVGITEIDTRALAIHIRENGAMKCVVSSEISDHNALALELEKISGLRGVDLAEKVSTKEAYNYGDENAALKIAVLDLGLRRDVLDKLSHLGAYLKVFPAKTTFDELKAFNPDGIYVSNGPGDPATMTYAIDTVKQIVAAKVPLFGIGLGFQLLAWANEIPTFKMHHGHYGLNNPVINLRTGRSEITVQNHGFNLAMDVAQNTPNVEITHKNLNDGIIEGIAMKTSPAFGVLYFPNTDDSNYLFEDFKKAMENQ